MTHSDPALSNLLELNKEKEIKYTCLFEFFSSEH